MENLLIRLSSLAAAVGACAVLATAAPARADVITENFTLDLSSPYAYPDTFPSTTSFDEFDPSQGTLDSVTVTLDGALNWADPSTHPFDMFIAAIHLHGLGEEVTDSQSFSITGGMPISTVVTLALDGTDSFSSDLAALTGTGTTLLDLAFEFADIGSTFSTPDGPLTGTITFNFTPASEAAVPEPAALAIFASGSALLGAFGLRGRNRQP